MDAQLARVRSRWFDVEQNGKTLLLRFAHPTLWEEDDITRIGEQLFHLLDNVGYRRFVLDFTPVLVVSTSMLAKLIAFHKKVKAADGRLVLCNLAPEIRYIFEWMRLTQVFNIRPGEQEALEAAGPESGKGDCPFAEEGQSPFPDQLLA
jgi:anti-sigma B factor antagonist